MEDVRFRAEEPNQLLATQEPAVRTILRGVARLADENERQKRPRSTNSDTPGQVLSERADATKRPHQVFLIDGSRGAGKKTYTLLTVEYALGKLSSHCDGRFVTEAWQKKFKDWLDPSEKPGQTAKDPAVPPVSKLMDIARNYGALVHPLRIIFPGDMEDGDAVMEAIFAAMTASTEKVVKDCKDRQSDPIRAGAGEKLNNKLRTDVAQGWYFARRFGLDAIVRDSTDYDDLVSLFEKESRKAAHRIDLWRDYVVEYLEYHRAAMLMVLLDDSDVRSDLTENILHAIRMYLDHPRIVTVVAGNLKAMRVSLLHLKMTALSSAVKALNSLGHPTAREWRRHERKEIEDYLEKILPPEQRTRVKRPEIVRSTDASGQASQSDFEIIVQKSMGEICTELMQRHRPKFLEVKFRLAIKRELNRSDASSDHERNTLEYFLSWWLFANRYRKQLQPQSVRQLKTWKLFFDEASGTFASTKRLPVMLFDNPANFMLIHRFSDDDTRVAEWLRRQTIEASWAGRRRFRVNDTDIDEGIYTYDYLKYRLDLGIAMPVRDNSDEVVAQVMLPSLVGRSFMRRFFQPRQMPRRHRSIGLVRWLNHAAIPANCVYFSDLSRLPDISFVSGLFSEKSSRKQIEKLQSGAWEAGLADRWMELIEDRQERPEDEYLLRYLREIVFEALRETGEATSGELDMVLDPPDPYDKRLHAVYEHFIDEEWECLGVEAHERRELFRDAAALLQTKTKLYSKDLYDKLRDKLEAYKDRRPDIRWPRMLALYSALTTDLRRAWHAIRIHQASPSYLLPDGGDGNARQALEHNAFAALANRDLMPLPTLKLITDVLDASDWTRALKDVFKKDNVLKVFSDSRAQDLLKTADERTQTHLGDLRFLFGGSNKSEPEVLPEILDPAKPQGPEEDRDFKKWTMTLRALCRTACYGWPVHDRTPPVGTLEPLFFREKFEGIERKSFMLKIFMSKDSQDQPLGDHLLNDKIRNGRAARSLVWLLWGLAPSLPAVIHANVMSFVYQAELERQAASKYAQGDGVDRVDDFYKSAIKLATDWAELVGTLAIIVRYVKIKCLQLDSALFLDRMLRDTGYDPDSGTVAVPVDARVMERRKAATADVGAFLKKCRYNLGDRSYEEAGAASLKTLDLILKEFWSPKDRAELTLARRLAIHPDVAPSSLFGDDWVQDLFQRQSVKDHFTEARRTVPGIPDPPIADATDNPLSVNGVFGEVEQWLWAASRSLRKLQTRIKEKHALAVKLAPQPGPVV